MRKKPVWRQKHAKTVRAHFKKGHEGFRLRNTALFKMKSKTKGPCLGQGPLEFVVERITRTA
ncbi:hypothetical protein B7994_00185 [Fibrobacter sp. UWR2]|nr:hypothetical protein B7994_00185 [Fibrobacter sp. UWR2]